VRAGKKYTNVNYFFWCIEPNVNYYYCYYTPYPAPVPYPLVGVTQPYPAPVPYTLVGVIRPYPAPVPYPLVGVMPATAHVVGLTVYHGVLVYNFIEYGSIKSSLFH
jgi:hypothetical protein